MPGSDRDFTIYQISRLCPTKFKINVIPALFAKTTQKKSSPWKRKMNKRGYTGVIKIKTVNESTLSLAFSVFVLPARARGKVNSEEKHKHRRAGCESCTVTIIVITSIVHHDQVSTALAYFLPFRLLPKPLRTNLTKEAAIFTPTPRPSSRDPLTARAHFSVRCCHLQADIWNKFA